MNVHKLLQKCSFLTCFLKYVNSFFFFRLFFFSSPLHVYGCYKPFQSMPSDECFVIGCRPETQRPNFSPFSGMELTPRRNKPIQKGGDVYDCFHLMEMLKGSPQTQASVLVRYLIQVNCKINKNNNNNKFYILIIFDFRLKFTKIITIKPFRMPQNAQ